MVLLIGDVPEPLWVRLVPSAPFQYYLEAPTGTTYAEIPVLRFQTSTGDILWVSSLSTDNKRATFSATPEQVNAAILANKTKNVRLTYGTRVWAVGKTEVVGPW